MLSEAVQIMETKDGPNGTKVLHYKADPIKDILTANEVKDLPLLVFSITGKTRGGKSFLLNLMNKYLLHEGKADWFDGPVPQLFEFKDGTDSTTKGLWLSTKVFKRNLKNGTQVGIMLMDNQGLFDGEVTSGESVAMSGVSTIISHVQMFNMKDKITTNDLEQIMLHLVPVNVDDKPSTLSNIGSNLMFVVRDFMGGNKYGFGLENGKKYIEEEQKRGTEEYRSMWRDQRSVFHKIDCLLLPHPGNEVLTEEFCQSPNLKALQTSFASEVNTFFKEIFEPDNLLLHNEEITGLKMHELLTQLDGKVADSNMSYYNMYIDRTNNIVMQLSEESFNKKLNILEDISNAKECMEDTLATTQFKGQSTDEYTLKLRQILERTINTKVNIYLVDMYEGATRNNNITTSHASIWPNIMTGLELLVGSELEVKQKTEDLIKELATFYYTKLAAEECEKFKNEVEALTPKQFYDKMLAVNQSTSFDVLLDSHMKSCADFEITGASESMLNDVRRKQQLEFGTNVKSNILRKMYKVKEYFVQNYKSQLVTENIKDWNARIWPTYLKDIDSLKFESESERVVHTTAIVQDISRIYYRIFREEVYKKMNPKWDSLNNLGINGLKNRISEEFPEYNMFKKPELSYIWVNERDVLISNLQEVIQRGLNARAQAEVERLRNLPPPPPQVIVKEVPVPQPAPPPQIVHVPQPAPPPQIVYVPQPAPPAPKRKSGWVRFRRSLLG